jgi:tight adherence protein B
MNPIVIIVGVVALLSVVFLVLAFTRVGTATDRTTQERLGRFVGDIEVAPAQQVQETGRGRATARIAQNIDEAIEGRGFAQKISTELARANLKITVTEYIMLIIISVVATAALFFFIYRNWPLALAGGVLGFFLPRFYTVYRKGRRLKAFNDQLGDTITLMANGLRSGYSLLMAMESVGQEMPDPIAFEFSRVVREISLGVSYERSMNNLLRRIPSDDLELMITAINVSHEVGGNLSEILDVIGEVIRERVRIAGEIKTLTAQGMLSGYIISFLPVALGLILFAMNQEYLGRMIFPNSTQPCGWIMIGVGVLLIGFGFTLVMKIVKIDI